MKLELKSKSQRKWIVGGLAFFGGVALLTTGFASWVIGIQMNQVNNQTTVSVDTSANKSIKLSTTLSDAAVSVSELYTGDENSIIKNTDGATDFKITFSSLKIQASPSFLDSNNITKISFAFAYGVTGVDSNKTDNNKLTLASDDDVGRTAGDYTYLDIPATSEIDVSGVDWSGITAVDGFKAYELTGKDVTIFSWGNYFDNESPCNYYNGLFSPSTITIELGDVITSQMKALNTAFDGGKIIVTATAEFAAKS